MSLSPNERQLSSASDMGSNRNASFAGDVNSVKQVQNTSDLGSQASFALNRNASFALDIGSVSTEQLAIRYPPGTAFLDTDVERTSKYIKSWTKRNMRFDESTRTLTYSRARGEADKGSIVCKNIIRLAEQYDVTTHDPSLYAVTVEGVMPDGKEESWRFRLLSEPEFFLWYNIIRRSIAAAGLMEPIDYGLPDVDPRNNTRFSSVPLEHLRKFILLERAILYYFGPCTMYTGPSTDSVQRNIIAVGDRCVYVFQSSSDVVRCVPLSAISGLMCPSDDSPATHFVVMQCSPVEHDLVIEHINDGVRLCEIISAVQHTHSPVKRPEYLEVQHICKGPIPEFVKTNKVQLLPDAKYEMKPISPTPKSKLKAALDLYSKEHGTMYQKNASFAKKRSMNRKSSKLTSKSSRAASEMQGTSSEAILKAIESSDPLVRLLGHQGLPQYIDLLVNQHIDVSLLSCMDPVDLTNFGVANLNHATLIVNAAKEKEETGTTPRPSHPPSQLASPAPTPNIAPASSHKPSVILLDDDDDVGSPVAKPPILLDDDSDDDLLPTAAKASVTASPPAQLPAGGAIALSDSDLDVAAPPVAAAPILLDDDDI